MGRFLFIATGVGLIVAGLVWMFSAVPSPSQDPRHARYQARFEKLQPAAEKGDSRAQFGLGVLYRDGLGIDQDLKEAKRLFNRAAEKGHTGAQHALGQLYESGSGVRQDYAKAREWYALSARSGNAKAQFALGQVYMRGRGVTNDYSEAVKWFRKAANQGHVVAQYLMGVVYAEGWGIKPDRVQAYMWFTLAMPSAKQVKAYDDKYDPVHQRTKLVARMNRLQIKKAEEKARDWRPGGQ